MYLSASQKHYKETGKHLSGYDFSKWLNNVHTKEKDQWIKEVSSKAVKQSIMNGDKAFKNFFKGASKFPRFKKKNRDVKAYFPKNNKTDWTVERHRIKIPTIGWVRLKEYGYIPKNVVVKSGTVSMKAGRWYVSVLCEIEKKERVNNLKNKGLGIDLGIKEFAIVSNGTVFENINKSTKLKRMEKKIKREQRSLSRKHKNLEKRGEKTVTRRANINKSTLRIKKLYTRISNIREEHIKSIVSQLVKTKPRYITIENLNIKGMMRNRHLSKAIAQQCFFTFKIWLKAKCVENGIELREVNRFYPSSKLCSCCGQIKKDLKLSDRVYKCECGNEIDRDLNAAINLLQTKKYVVLT